MVKFVVAENNAKEKPRMEFKPGLKLADHMKTSEFNGGTLVELIGAGNFGAAFYERQSYEVTAGREEVALVYESFYETIRSADLPKVLKVNTIGPAGVVFERIVEGGEAKFISITSESAYVEMYHYAVAMEYSKDLIVYNQTFSFAPIERRVGKAFNALLNHIHISPILDASYVARNQTAAVTEGNSLAEAYMNTVAAGILAAKQDTTYPRPGRYDLLISSANMWTFEKMFNWRTQDGANPHILSAMGMIDNVIVYDGWNGTRGKKTTTYPGVTAGTAYLIDKSMRGEDFISYVKQDLQSANGPGDLTRFILEQVVWDAYFTAFASPLRAVEEITLPTTFDGPSGS